MGNSQMKYTITSGNSKHAASSNKFGDHSKSISNSYPEFIVKLGEVLEAKSLKEEYCPGIGKKTFQKYISEASEVVGKKLFEFFLTKEDLHSGSSDSESKTLTKAAFVRQAYVLLNCVTDSQQLEYYIQVFADDKEEMSHKQFYELVLAAYEIAQFAHHSCCLPDNILSAICKTVMHGKEQTTRKYVFTWICQHCPRIVMWMHRYITHTLTVGHSTIPANVPTEESEEEEMGGTRLPPLPSVGQDDNVTPILDCANKSSCARLHPALIWMLSCSLPNSFTKNSSPPPSFDESLSTMKDPHKFIKQLILADKPSHWIPLFNTDEHGLSINRFQHHVFDYHGPTLLFVTADDADDTMFCVASDEEWRDSKHFYGGPDAMCVQLCPDYKIIEKGAKILYFNISSRGFPTGLQVGADSTNRALSIDINLELVHHRKIPYKLKSIEVWGCGTNHAKQKQMEYKKQANKDVEKCRKVNMTQDWKDNPDRYLLEMAGGRPNYARFEKDTQNHSSLK